MQMFRYAEEGSIRFLWIIATNPAVGLAAGAASSPLHPRAGPALRRRQRRLPDRDRATRRRGSAGSDLGEKTGTFTNHDRTVHLSEKAVDPPGQARPDMEIFLDYARRLGLTDADGAPLVKWSAPQECFEAFASVTRGGPCDYSGLSYDKLRGAGGIQWPCTDEHPEGTERLYTDHTFNTGTDYCEDYGHDLLTGPATSARITRT
jgi:hypothetical protein